MDCIWAYVPARFATPALVLSSGGNKNYKNRQKGGEEEEKIQNTKQSYQSYGVFEPMESGASPFYVLTTSETLTSEAY